MYKHSPQLSEYTNHQAQLVVQRQKIQVIYNAKFEMVYLSNFSLLFCFLILNFF